jgi:hypothetical protein
MEENGNTHPLFEPVAYFGMFSEKVEGRCPGNNFFSENTMIAKSYDKLRSSTITARSIVKVTHLLKIVIT